MADPVFSAPTSPKEEARAKANPSADQQDRILAGLIHELKTPLSAIVLWTTFLDDHRSELSPMVRKALDSIKRSARDEQKLIEELGLAVRIVTGRLGLEPVPVDLAPLVRSAIQLAREGAADQALKIEERFAPTLPAVSGDSEWIRQMVERLVHHSVKRTPAGGKIIVALETEEAVAKLTVTDTGRHLPADLLSRPSEQKAQADGSPRPDTRLAHSLAIVKQIVELHGGTLGGSGATFTVRLPRSPT